MSFTAKNNGGEYSHQLTIEELPAHNHMTVKGECTTSFVNGRTKIDDKHSTYQAEEYISTGYYWCSRTLNEGGNNKHNNVQPYFVVYFWKRIK